MNKKPTIGSLFAGIGGICLAFKNAGFNVAWANEIDSHACQTYRLNFPNTNLIETDVKNLELEKLQNVDVITSGFPCQAFSIAGYREGFNDKKGRGNLFFQTARIIKYLKPKAYFLENVRNLVGHDKGRTFSIIKDVIKNELGYSFIPFVLNSKDFGNIPQTRERIYIVGFRHEAKFEHIDFENNTEKEIKTFNFNIPLPVKLTKSIHDLMIKKRVDDEYYYKPIHRYYGKLSSEMKNGHTLYQWRRVYVRENKSNLCPTLTANMGTGGHNVPILKDKYGIRKLTPRECLNFMGFPYDFEFPNSMAKSHCYKQAGNSVVVPVVERIAKEIFITINSTK